MSQAQPAAFRLNNFILRESHIVFQEGGEFELEVGFEPKGLVFPDLKQFHLELGVSVRDKESKLKIEVVAIGVFEFQESIPLEDLKRSYFTINAPAIMFPYIRAYLATLTAQSGVTTINLPTYNLSGLGEVLAEHITVAE